MPPASKPGPSKIRRAISITIFCILILVIFLMLRKPKPVAEPQAPSVVAANAQSFQQKLTDLAQPASSESSSSAPAEVAFTTAEVQAALVEANSPQVAAAAAATQRATETPNSVTRPPADQASLPANAPPPIITFENDVVRGQFQAEVSGQTVWVTVAGHLGAQDGYATFEPTEFKIGDLTVPVSLVNGSLQKKLLEQRDKLKLPDFIADIAVQNSQLVIKRK